ncbi:MAG: hypothetical protein K8R87_10470 [Verrucomicrobia bacterium]|nr:hypothetical protein [Verrucomicrobiota bacterium]
MRLSPGFKLFVLVLLVLTACCERSNATEVIHLFVALADNASQGIAPVPAKIGDGDSPENNLYWGCSEGVKAWFLASKQWKKVSIPASPRAEILERVVFRHREKDAWLVADAWRGRGIRPCLQSFVSAATGEEVEEIKLGDSLIRAGGASTLVAYIGHNGLMDFQIDWRAGVGQRVKPAIVLCCLSHEYFSAKLTGSGACPVLMTTQLMYPGAFVLHAALEAWLHGKTPAEMRDAAAAAYSKNQGISIKAARGVFSAE